MLLSYRSFGISMQQIIFLCPKTGLYGKRYEVRPPILQQQRVVKTRRNVIVSVKSKTKSRLRRTRRVKTIGIKGRICGIVIPISQIVVEHSFIWLTRAT